MKFDCHCGDRIADHSDDLPHKAHLIPDQNWNALWDRIDDEILPKLEKGRQNLETTAMQLRILFGDAIRAMYQCRECGRLYINDEHGKLHCYVPQDDAASCTILKEHPTP
ncbi:MAG TPA: hypothetical protein VNQ76_06885 [Planctomicrobium sp.]|nr:hypothetical protein [Planctomicrobium sp.]